MTMQLSLPDAGAYTGIDWRRTRLFATFGALFVGAWQYALFSVAVPRALPYMAAWAQRPLREKLRDPRGLLQLGCLVAVENCFNQPLLHFPILYSIKQSIADCDDAWTCIRAGCDRAWANCVEDNKASCGVWVPATIFNGMFVPAWARVPMMTFMGCGWTCFISATRGPFELSPDPGKTPSSAGAIDVVHATCLSLATH
jgi:hypothetical protein